MRAHSRLEAGGISSPFSPFSLQHCAIDLTDSSFPRIKRGHIVARVSSYFILDSTLGFIFGILMVSTSLRWQVMVDRIFGRSWLGFHYVLYWLHGGLIDCMEGFHKDGIHIDEFLKDGFHMAGFHKDGLHMAGIHTDGTCSIVFSFSQSITDSSLQHLLA